jgi:hypothetical protein
VWLFRFEKANFKVSKDASHIRLEYAFYIQGKFRSLVIQSVTINGWTAIDSKQSVRSYFPNPECWSAHVETEPSARPVARCGITCRLTGDFALSRQCTLCTWERERQSDSSDKWDEIHPVRQRSAVQMLLTTCLRDTYSYSC